jgi:cytidylate kinase
MNSTENVPVIAIDGPGGSGKGTISQLVASRLGWHYLDSGALYRLTALASINHTLGFDNESSIATLAEHLDVQFGADGQIVLEGEEVTEAIRTEEIGEAASVVAALPAVRQALLNRQRAFREAPGLVADGRDMGSVVFPDAELKIFLTASAEARAERRYKQLKEKGISVNLAHLLEDIQRRDERDSQRAAAPMKVADDAIQLDTTTLSIEQVVNRVLSHCSQWLDEEETPLTRRR